MALLDNVVFLATGGGTADFAVDVAIAGYQTPALAGAEDGEIYRMHAESVDKSQWEIVYGAWNEVTQTFARTVVLYNSLGTGSGPGQSGAGSKINFSNPPRVGIVAVARDWHPDVLQTVTSASDTISASTSLLAIQRNAPSTTALALPSVLDVIDGHRISILDWSTAVTDHVITLTPAGSETVMKAATWPMYSNAAQLSSLTLRANRTLNGWYIAP